MLKLERIINLTLIVAYKSCASIKQNMQLYML